MPPAAARASTNLRQSTQVQAAPPRPDNPKRAASSATAAPVTTPRGRTFDPNIQTQFSSKGYTLFYERLLAYNPRTYKIEPELGQRWEQPSPTEYLFTVQPGVKWQDKPPVSGRPLTVDDVRFSLERARTNDPRFYSYSILAGIDKIEAPGAATVRITTKAPDASTLIKLCVEQIAILSREVLEKYPKPATADSAVGTGAFMMKSVEERVAAEYVRNPDYWKPGRPYLDGVRTRQFDDQLTAYGAFQSGLLDILALPGEETKGYIAKQGSGYTPEWFKDDTVGFMAQPNIKVKPMDDLRVTRALRLLIDHDECITAAETTSGRGRHGGVFALALEAWDLSHDEYAKLLE